MEQSRSRKRISPEQVARKWCQLSQDQPGFEEKYINQYIGYGLFATRNFSKGDFLLEYRGVHRPDTAAETDDVDNTYVFEYRHNGEDMLIDATDPNSCLARYINDSHKYNNAIMKKKTFSGNIHLCLYALCDIKIGVEIRYDYGIPDLPWRQVVACHPTSELLRLGIGTIPQEDLNHGVYFLQKVQLRYHDQPEIYQKFVQILYAYQEEQHNAKKSVDTSMPVQSMTQLCEQVTDLFKNQEDLLEGFNEFLSLSTVQSFSRNGAPGDMESASCEVTFEDNVPGDAQGVSKDQGVQSFSGNGAPRDMESASCEVTSEDNVPGDAQGASKDQGVQSFSRNGAPGDMESASCVVTFEDNVPGDAQGASKDQGVQSFSRNGALGDMESASCEVTSEDNVPGDAQGASKDQGDGVQSFSRNGAPRDMESASCVVTSEDNVLGDAQGASKDQDVQSFSRNGALGDMKSASCEVTSEDNVPGDAQGASKDQGAGDKMDQVTRRSIRQKLKARIYASIYRHRETNFLSEGKSNISF
ncbi:uncharacterized protein [Amphiura filiformis]|uniref:uncharacterized protein n=1 Tax=Amphiura filiformis TaxID=82378 RepID=UPI003B228999